MATMTESSYPGARMLLQPSSAVLQSLNLCSQYFSYPYAGVPCSCAQCQSTAKTPAPPTSSFSSPGYNYLRYHPHYSASGQGGFRTPQWSANPTDFNNGGYCTCCSRMQGGSIYQSQTSNLSLNPTAFTADSSSEYSEPVSAVSEPYSKMPMQYPPSVSECCSLSQSVSPPLSVSSSSTSSPLSHHSAVSPSQLSDAYDSSPEHADEGTPENCEWSFASASKNSGRCIVITLMCVKFDSSFMFLQLS